MYASLGGAFLEIFYVCIGSPDFAVGDHGAPAFFENNQGDTSMHIMLLLLYFITCFILLIHLLNMLIAIMGDAYSEDKEVFEKQRIMNFLKFINDKWHFKNFAFDIDVSKGEKKKETIEKTKYVIVALNQEDQPQDTDLIREL